VVLLAIDTATPTTTVAVADDTTVLATGSQVDGRRHAEILAPMIADVLGRASVRPSDLDRIVVGVGPGPFTGLRVGLATALALGDALDRPVLGVVTLDVIAEQSTGPVPVESAGPLVVATDARRKEVFWAVYEQGRRVVGPSVDPPGLVADRHPHQRIAGEGAQTYASVFEAAGCTVVEPAFPSAAVLATLTLRRLTQGIGFEPVEPLYLRRPDVSPPTPRKPVTPP